AGNGPLQAPLSELQSVIDAPQQTLALKGKPVPAASSGLVDAERALLQSRGLLDSQGKITPWVLAKDTVNTPERLLTPELWNSIYDVPRGDITIEHIQHAFYMAANYGLQIVDGNFAAAFDDYTLRLRIMYVMAHLLLY